MTGLIEGVKVEIELIKRQYDAQQLTTFLHLFLAHSHPAYQSICPRIHIHRTTLFPPLSKADP